METITFDTKKLESFYNATERFLHQLADVAGLRKEDLNKYYHAEQQFDIHCGASMNQIYLRLLLSLQNRQRMSNIVNMWPEEQRDKYRKVFFEYNPKVVAKKYKDVNSLYKAIQSELGIWTEGADYMRKQWCQGAIEAANILAKYKSVVDLIKEWDKHVGVALPIYWDKNVNICGMGFALSCDFFKEIGYDLPKPDVHIREVFKKVFEDQLQSVTNDEDLCKAFISAAKQLGEIGTKTTAYKFDKMIWLACTNNFYLDNVPTSLRERLLAKCTGK